MNSSSTLTFRTSSHPFVGNSSCLTRPKRVYVLSRHSKSRIACTQQTSRPGKQNIEEAGSKLLKVLAEWNIQAQASFLRTWAKLNAEFQLQERAAKTVRKAKETLVDVDQTYHVRRKLRNAVEVAQRKWPVWQAQLDAFATTWYGKATILFVLWGVMSSPLFWRLVNLLLFVGWLAIPVGISLLQAAARKAAQRAQEAAEEQARASNPFASFFDGARAAASGSSSSSRSRSGRSSSSRKQGGGEGRRQEPQGGPIIDAEYEVIRDEKKKK